MHTSHVCLVLLALAAPSIGFTFPGTGSTFARYQNRFQHGVTPTASFQEHDPTNRVEWATTTTTSTTTPTTPTSHGAVNNVRIALLTNMGESTEVKDIGLSLDTKGNDPVYTFSLKSKAPSSLIKEAQSQAIKEASISEAFPGVRMVSKLLERNPQTFCWGKPRKNNYKPAILVRLSLFVCLFFFCLMLLATLAGSCATSCHATDSFCRSSKSHFPNRPNGSGCLWSTALLWSSSSSWQHH